jgi:hypothetical protein
MKRLAFLLLLATAGCYIAVHDEDHNRRSATVAGSDATWQATMREGERALFDGGALEVTLQRAQPGFAALLIRDARGQNQVDLRGTGTGAGVIWPPYHVWLGTAGTGTATIMVSRADPQ